MFVGVGLGVGVGLEVGVGIGVGIGVGVGARSTTVGDGLLASSVAIFVAKIDASTVASISGVGSTTSFDPEEQAERLSIKVATAKLTNTL